jgi:hypothetical protein
MEGNSVYQQFVELGPPVMADAVSVNREIMKDA